MRRARVAATRARAAAQPGKGMVSTRDDVRPFLAEEQRRILGAGACLGCHYGKSAVMQQAIADNDVVIARRSRRCVVPAWR